MDKELIIKKLKETFEEKKYTGYDTSENQQFSVWKEEKEKLRNGTIKDVFIVSFWSEPLFGERQLIFATIDAESLEFFYISGPSGYIEI